MCKSISLSINVTYFVVHDMNRYMIKQSSNLSLYSLDSTSFYWHITAYERVYKSLHETTLADFNRYMTATCLVIILMDDAIKYTCIWALTSCNM